MSFSAKPGCWILNVRLAQDGSRVANEVSDVAEEMFFDVLVEGATIRRVERAAGDTRKIQSDAAGGQEMVNGDGAWLLPGWIDMQINDMDWLSRSEHTDVSTEQHVKRIGEVLKHQARLGVTGLCLVRKALVVLSVALLTLSFSKKVAASLPPASRLSSLLARWTYEDAETSGGQLTVSF